MATKLKKRKKLKIKTKPTLKKTKTTIPQPKIEVIIPRKNPVWMRMPDVMHDWIMAVTRVVELQAFVCTVPFVAASSFITDTVLFEPYRGKGENNGGRTT